MREFDSQASTKAAVCINIALIVAILVIIWSPRIYYGLEADYFQTADQDLILITQALTVNSGIPTSFIHPGYITIVLLALIITGAKLIGLVSVHNISELAQSQNLTLVLDELTKFARIYSLLCISGLVAAFVLLIYLLTRRLYIALLSGLILASSSGVFVHSMMLRTEILSLFFSLLALVFLIYALNTLNRFFFFYLFCVGVFLYCAIITKVQAALLLYLIPLVVFAYAKRWKAPDLSSPFIKYGWLITVLFISCLLLLVYWGSAVFLQPLYDPSRAGVQWYHHLLNLVCLGTVASLRIMRSWPILSSLAGLLAIWLGMLATYPITFVNQHTGNHGAVIYFFNLMADGCAVNQCLKPELIASLQSAIQALFDTISTKFNPLNLLEYPNTLVYWLTLTGIFFLFRYRQSRAGFYTLTWLIIALVMEFISRMRWPDWREVTFICYYYIYVELFLFVAFAYILEMIERKVIQYDFRKVTLLLGITTILILSNVFVNLGRYRHDRFSGLSFHQGLDSVCRFIGYTPAASFIFSADPDCLAFVTRDYKRAGILRQTSDNY